MLTSLAEVYVLCPTPSLIPPLSSTAHRPRTLRCSGTQQPATVSPHEVAAVGGKADCVVVGGGITGLFVAKALTATRHGDVAPNVIVTEARDRVGGNIIPVERDGYLWEEGPNTFQPSDPMLTMACGLRIEGRYSSR